MAQDSSPSLLRADSIVTGAKSDATIQSFGVSPALTASASGDGSPPSPVSSAGDDVRTIWVSGFPNDVLDRELHNLLYSVDGYQASQMSINPASGTPPQGFALFASHAAAKAAVQLLNGRPFERGYNLRCEMARKNLYLKDDLSIRRVDESVPVRSQSAPQVLLPALVTVPTVPDATPLGLPASLLVTPQGALHPAAAAAAAVAAMAPAQQAGLDGLLSVRIQADLMAAQQVGLVRLAPVGGMALAPNKHDNAPCNTLFIGNLGDAVSQSQLTALFSFVPGFKQLKLAQQSQGLSCFVEFVDVATASIIHAALQGATLPSSDRGPIRVQYSKNPFGKRGQGMAAAGVAAAAPAAALLAAGLTAPTAPAFGAAAVGGGAGAGLNSSWPLNAASLLDSVPGTVAVLGGGGGSGIADLGLNELSALLAATANNPAAWLQQLGMQQYGYGV